jgi:hypothetical protein
MHYKSKKRQMKEFITSLFYDVEFFSGSVTTLAGPDLVRVVNSFKKLEPDTIHVYETCPRTFEKQVKDKYKHFNGDDDIVLHFDNLSNAPVTELIDADLMKTFKTDGEIIEELFKRQLKLDAQRKVFIGTLSLRKTPRADVFNWLNDLLSGLDCFVTDEIEYTNSEGSLLFVQKHVTIVPSSVHAFDAFTYSDKEGIMFTFRIIY